MSITNRRNGSGLFHLNDGADLTIRRLVYDCIYQKHPIIKLKASLHVGWRQI
ncbi:hypothetical protein UUU_25740 [Klebsiella pneumoniae subsp. pneumoniae DSM 30104 = JCM 1662 = NBRC 14940]|nr:hypothetical protein UUU_25740 [Klebsiella pneumoniae subsp. pneumoniae DSM 30104 = JCM 1662 = NBRC 14940]